MKGILYDPPEFLFEWRRKTGADQFDEVWDGVMHMVPSPNIEHQDFEGALIAWLRTHWKHSGRRVLHNVNVSPSDDWIKDYRIPDIVLLQPEDTRFVRGDFIQGPPSVVIEIRSPGDESYEKLPFYARLGVAEVWIIDRDSRDVELHHIADAEYRLLPLNDLGWLASNATGIELRPSPGNQLTIRLAGDESSMEHLP